MKVIISTIWIVLLFKNLLFWAWLWQLKEYHTKRFKAHFETRSSKKFLASFYRIKFPHLTFKSVAILGSGLILMALLLYTIWPLTGISFYAFLLLFYALSPLIFSLWILLFQIPTYLFKRRLIKRATRERKKFKDLTVIGITGSYGKTSTKEFLAKMLSEKYKVLKTPRHINSEIGIARTILKEIDSEFDVFVVEMGAYEKGKIKEVANMVRPHIGILTGINAQHLSTFGSIENIIQGKYELIESLPEDGMAIFNGENSYCRDLYNKTEKPKKMVGLEEKQEFSLWTEELKLKKQGTVFTAVTKKGERQKFNLSLIGLGTTENILLASAAAMEMKVSLEKISRIALHFKPLEGSLDLYKNYEGVNVLDATYSSNLHGVLSHLDYLKIWPDRKIIVMPCLIELGKSSREIHYKIGEKIGKVADYAIITTPDWFNVLKRGAIRGGMDSSKITLIEKSKDILERLRQVTDFGDVVLLENRVPKEVKKYRK